MITQTGSPSSPSADPEQRPGAAVLLQLDADTLAVIDSFAAARQVSRSDAVHRLLQLGIESLAPNRPLPRISTSRAEELATSQIGPLIDPDASSEERDRRIERLTKGPPEFIGARLDQSKPTP